MRENIGLYRGKRIDNGEWVEGFLVKKIDPLLGSKCCFILAQEYDTSCIDGQPTHLNSFMTWYKVDSATVGQYTGLTANGKKIFEGDIVTAQDNVIGSPFCDGITGKIVYDETAFFIEPKDPMESQWLFNECAVYEVIGNIHDNPELLE